MKPGFVIKIANVILQNGLNGHLVHQYAVLDIVTEVVHFLIPEQIVKKICLKQSFVVPNVAVSMANGHLGHLGLNAPYLVTLD